MLSMNQSHGKGGGISSLWLSLNSVSTLKSDLARRQQGSAQWVSQTMLCSSSSPTLINQDVQWEMVLKRGEAREVAVH